MKTVIILSIIVCLVASNLLLIDGAAAISAEKIPVIIGFRDRPNSELVQAFGGSIKYEYKIIPAIACSLPQQAIEALKKNPSIAYIEDDVQVFAVDSELDWSWGVKHIGAGIVHESGNTGAGIKVAVIDTGINRLHEDLIGNYKGGVDFVNNDGDPMDDNGHGTHCAGIIAAADNNIAVVGVAPQADLYGVKVLDSTGSGYVSTVIVGIEWATQNGMQVISMSLGSSSGLTSLQLACDTAYNQGIVVVAAAGNSGAARGRIVSNIIYPARYASVIAVGATDSNDARASFSCTGPELELVAPGVNILSTYIDVSPYDGRNIDTYYMSGTSMACPHVAGTAALVLKSDETAWSPQYTDGNGVWSSAEVRKVLIMTADDLGASGKDNLYGYGLVDADEAAPAPSVDNTPPTITALAPADGAVINMATPTISATVSDVSGIGSVVMILDGSPVSPAYDGATGLVSYQSTGLSESSHAVSLTVADTLGNTAAKTWSFTVDTIPPVQVTGLTITVVSSSRLDLAWDSMSDAAKYNIYRGGERVATTTMVSYSDTGLAASTTYYYSVTAVDSAGNEGTASTVASATTSGATLNVMHVSNVVVSLGSRTAGVNTFYWGIAKVTVIDTSGQAVAGATVYGHWEGATSDSDTGITDSAGTVTLTSDSVKKPSSGTVFTFVVDNVVLSGWTYQVDPKPSGTATR